jgi:hypothetical protein
MRVSGATFSCVAIPVIVTPLPEIVKQIRSYLKIFCPRLGLKGLYTPFAEGVSWAVLPTRGQRKLGEARPTRRHGEAPVCSEYARHAGKISPIGRSACAWRSPVDEPGGGISQPIEEQKRKIGRTRGSHNL